VAAPSESRGALGKKGRSLTCGARGSAAKGAGGRSAAAADERGPLGNDCGAGRGRCCGCWLGWLVEGGCHVSPAGNPAGPETYIFLFFSASV